jgi:hypothetical protein
MCLHMQNNRWKTCRQKSERKSFIRLLYIQSIITYYIIMYSNNHVHLYHIQLHIFVICMTKLQTFSNMHLLLYCCNVWHMAIINIYRYLNLICNTPAFFLAPCKIFNMQVVYLYLISFITDATVDLLTNNLKSWGWLFYNFDKKMSHWHTARIYMKLSKFEDTLNEWMNL